MDPAAWMPCVTVETKSPATVAEKLPAAVIGAFTVSPWPEDRVMPEPFRAAGMTSGPMLLVRLMLAVPALMLVPGSVSVWPADSDTGWFAPLTSEVTVRLLPVPSATLIALPLTLSTFRLLPASVSTTLPMPALTVVVPDMTTGAVWLTLPLALTVRLVDALTPLSTMPLVSCNATTPPVTPIDAKLLPGWVSDTGPVPAAKLLGPAD